MQSINWSELAAEAGKAGEIPPPGPYLASVEAVDFMKTKKGDKDMIRLRYRIDGGPEKGKALFDNLTFSPENPNALVIVFGKLTALGVDGASFGGMSDDQVREQLVGRQARLTVAHEEWKGQTRAQVEKVERSDGASAPAPAAPAAPAPQSLPGAVAAPAPTTTPAPAAAPERLPAPPPGEEF